MKSSFFENRARNWTGEISPALFQNLKKSALNLGKKCPNQVHLWV